ncbi:deoxyribodipyrimidine photo-lyase-like isoform X1 [Rhineura floridana]|uniref:deoxyribodipyrimidine photo-lyase-like isoform X1 n=1 Tax=Rhineura floridana TaxID=261503 RepID=UPI002AC8163E|nr:deoxyribodipyrimidine photo-lyase-like isoform X1 [Rhineura floridana]XP_061493560.1 deoxyribodipyrimidine photo-lyase-like isoform X1 [Rhineura floridana]XP_061493561.1 deoxyribodipyrimidine photo-lyase-like isoform X1 [Rhineura floridana]
MPQKRGKQKPPGSMEPDDASSSDGLGSNRKVAVMSAAAASPGGKKKVEEEGAGSGGAGTLAESVKQARLKAVPSVAEFKYNKRRVRLVSQDPDLKEGAQGILYWMSRDQRVQDNWAFLYAQRLALKQKLPLHICFCLVPKFLEATIRHFGFLLRGLKEVAEECKELSVPFHLLVGFAKDLLPPFVTQHGIGGVVTDFAPLRVPMQWVENVRARLPPDVPFVQVDAHNIVPCWVASDKQEYGARTIRRKIHDRLAEFLTEFPPVIKHPYPAEFQAEPVDWDACYASLQVDRSVKEVDWAQPGTASGLAMLEEFMKERLKFFGTDRNNPNQAALSNLSPWFHFGQISVQRAILEVCKLRSRYKESVESFIEEAVVRRELADNFCYYNQNYDKVEGAYDWAKTTLKLHAKDKRPHLYMLKQLEEGKTHDPLWNAAQLQMVHEGKMHGFLRMYWAKKILEWTTSPEEALEFSIYLNDRYELDGRDPNGYVGCMWSICGIHDQGWAERAVFGKIRYMNYAGCKRKFDVDQFECKYNPRKFSQQPLRSNNSKGKWRSKAGNAVPVKGCSSSRGK